MPRLTPDPSRSRTPTRDSRDIVYPAQPPVTANSPEGDRGTDSDPGEMSRFTATLHLIGREGTRLFTFEVVATLYFGVLAAVSPFSGASRRWAGVAAALGLAATIIAMSRLLFPGARVWLAHLYLAAAYWLPALLVTRPSHRFEA
jgi:hypothetical protein